MEKSVRKRWILRLVRADCLTFCLAFFVHQFSFIYQSFKDEETAVALDVREDRDLFLPHITVCPQPAFKGNRMYHDTRDSYLNSTYGYRELFPGRGNGNKKRWNISEFWGLASGRCYTFRNAEPVVPMSSTDFILARAGKSVNVYGKISHIKFMLATSGHDLPDHRKIPGHKKGHYGSH